MQAALAACAAALASGAPAFADVPAGYEPVTITNVDQLADYTHTDNTAFIIGADITDSAYRMIGSHQYWADGTPNTHTLSFEGFESHVQGAVMYIGQELAMHQFGQLSFADNTTSHDYGGAIFGDSSGIITFNGNESVMFNGNSSYIDGGAIYAKSTLNLTDNGNLSFTGNSVSSSGGAIYAKGELNLTGNGSLTLNSNKGQWGGAIYGSGSIDVSGNKSVTFGWNTVFSYGGAIYGSNSSTIALNDNNSLLFCGNEADWGGGLYTGYHNTTTLSDNGSVTFSENYAYVEGSAIYGDESGTVTISGNDSVTFSKNTAVFEKACGGAVHSEGTLNLTDNGSVDFSGNSSTGVLSEGGALYAGEWGSVTFSGNDSVTFSENYTFGTGGAIHATGALELVDNTSVDFSGNFALGIVANGGALYVDQTSITTLSGNGSVTFSENTSIVSRGGAVYAKGTLRLTENGSVTFSGNSALKDGGAVYLDGRLRLVGNGDVAFSGNSVEDRGGAIYCNGGLDLIDNGNVTFSGNSANLWGGAICTDFDASITINGNESVTFSGNYEKTEGIDATTYRLRSVYMDGGTLKLAAGEGQSITFYDTLWADFNPTVSFNAAYRDKDGEMRDATGDIVFSGARAEADLAAINPDFSPQELTNSKTSEVDAATNLYGGRLRIEDGAIYKGKGINVAAGSNATLRLDGGTLDQTGGNVSLASGCTLDLAGENTITASTLQMADGTAMLFMMGSGQQSPILNLDATLQTGGLSVSVDGDYANEHVLITLADAAQYDISAWTPDKVTVRGTDLAHLVWNEGSLYYRPADITDITLVDDTEVDNFGDEEGVDINGNGHKLTVKDSVELVQLTVKDGVVRLEDADNNVVRIRLTENGTLQLAEGAKLNLGNTVGMERNNSDADMVISGDVAISDIKACGNPDGKGSLGNVNMTTAEDYTIENMTITGSLIDIGEGTTLYLVNVDIKSDSHITDAPARAFAQNSNIQLDQNNTWVDRESTAVQDKPLYMCGDTQQAITMAAGSRIVELTCRMFDSVTLTGTDLWLDMTGTANQVAGCDYFTLDFQDLARQMAKAQLDVERLHVYATLDGEQYLEAYSTTNEGLVTTLYFQVPEPATTTLSLLALAALAARRRK